MAVCSAQCQAHHIVIHGMPTCSALSLCVAPRVDQQAFPYERSRTHVLDACRHIRRVALSCLPLKTITISGRLRLSFLWYARLGKMIWKLDNGLNSLVLA
eukprot:4448534-Amphidinium_carterae.1